MGTDHTDNDHEPQVPVSYPPKNPVGSLRPGKATADCL